jgi:hypothetical protein
MTSLPSPPLQVTPAMQARAGVGAWAIAIAIHSGRSRWSRCCPCCRKRHQGCPLPPQPCCHRPYPPCLQSPLPSFPGRRSTLKHTCLGPPHRPFPLRAHQQRKSRAQQCPGPPPLYSVPLPSQLLLSWPRGCAGNDITLTSLCRQVE